MLNLFFWFWIPIFAMGIQIILELSFSGSVLSAMHSENGPHETLQAILMVFSFCISSHCFLNSKISKTYLLRFWFGLATLCCFYVTGEEVSWGQHLWHWPTPEFWATLNDQKETNFHNTSSWLDQKPRLILILGIIIGTLVVPILKKYNILQLPAALDMLLPSKKLTIIALFVVVPQLIEKIFEIFGVVIFARFSEVQELYIFYFVLLYLVFLKKKIQSDIVPIKKS